MLELTINNRIQRVLNHGQYIMGPEVRELEESLESRVGAKHCITVSSGTDALLIALMALKVGRGDEVITTPFTYAATAEVIALLGATPVFVDIEQDTCNMDVACLLSAINSRTKAIIPVSIFGQPCDMDEINSIAEIMGIAVIEDAAQSFGATYRGRPSCGLSKISCTSFFPSKPLGAYGDGGAIFTNDDALANDMRQLRIHGQSRRYYHTNIGIAGRMDTLQCAIVLGKLERFEWEVTQRLKIGARYLEALKEVDNIKLPVIKPDRTSVWAQFTLQTNNRATMIEYLNSNGIPTVIYYPLPLNKQPAFEKICRIPGSLDYANYVSDRVFSLPMHPYMSEEIQEIIISAVSRFECYEN